MWAWPAKHVDLQRVKGYAQTSPRSTRLIWVYFCLARVEIDNENHPCEECKRFLGIDQGIWTPFSVFRNQWSPIKYRKKGCKQCLSLVLDTAAAKLLQSCPTLCDPRDSSPPGSPVPGILQARTLEWVAISFSNAWEWKVKVKSLSRVRLLVTPWTAAYQAPLSMGFSRQYLILLKLIEGNFNQCVII